MNARAQAAPRSQAALYEALLRAAKSIAACNDCDSAASCLARELHNLVEFDYLQVFAFDDDGTTVWQITEQNQKVEKTSLVGLAQIADTPAAWVHEHHEALVISDWSRETSFLAHGQAMREMGVRSSCALPLTRGSRRL